MPAAAAAHDASDAAPWVCAEEVLDATLLRWGSAGPWLRDDGRPLGSCSPATSTGLRRVADGLGRAYTFAQLTLSAPRRTVAYRVLIDGRSVIPFELTDEATVRFRPVAATNAFLDAVRGVAAPPSSAAGDEVEGVRLPTGVAQCLRAEPHAALGPDAVLAGVPESDRDRLVTSYLELGLLRLVDGKLRPGPLVARYQALRAVASAEEASLLIGRRTVDGFRSACDLRLAGTTRTGRWAIVQDPPDHLVLVPVQGGSDGDVLIEEIASRLVSWASPPHDSGAELSGAGEEADTVTVLLVEDPQSQRVTTLRQTAARSFAYEDLSTGLRRTFPSAALAADEFMSQLGPIDPVRASTPPVVGTALLGQVTSQCGAKRVLRRLRCITTSRSETAIVMTLWSVLLTDAGAIGIDDDVAEPQQDTAETWAASSEAIRARLVSAFSGSSETAVAAETVREG